jgi:presenilin-like A22 family membrane protease
MPVRLKTQVDLQISFLKLLLIPCMIGPGFGVSLQQALCLILLFLYIQFLFLLDVSVFSLKCTICALWGIFLIQVFLPIKKKNVV